MRQSDFEGTKDIAPLGERAGIVLKVLMVFNEGKRR
jgi:hypothetical protein